MSILKYKYKAHKLVNILFYLFVFLIGFVFGLGFKELDFNKLISNILMIDNVEAYTIVDNENVVLDEKFIYDSFSQTFSDFNILTYNYIICEKSTNTLQCYFFDLNSFSSFEFIYSNNIYHFSSDFNDFKYFTIRWDLKSSNFSIEESFSYITYPSFSWAKSFFINNIYTNFDLELLTEEKNKNINLLDFSKYTTNLIFNENLFKDNPDFKEVCVNKNSSFSITKKTTDGIMSENNHDFIWFPYGISGIKQFNYSTEMSDGYFEFVDPYENFYFSSYDSINSIWNTEYMADNFESKGYTDKYKYYGYTAYLFLHWYNFTDGQTYNFFPIFELTDNVTTSYISSSGNIHGGGGTRLDGDEEIELSDEYCFYIKNEYEVNDVILDEWGDHYTSVNTPNGIINYGTTVNKDNSNSKSFLLQPLEFISQMSGTIAFINTHIYNFYMAMPLIVRTFIVTALIISIVILIMKIGGYK